MIFYHSGFEYDMNIFKSWALCLTVHSLLLSRFQNIRLNSFFLDNFWNGMFLFPANSKILWHFFLWQIKPLFKAFLKPEVLTSIPYWIFLISSFMVSYLAFEISYLWDFFKEEASLNFEKSQFWLNFTQVNIKIGIEISSKSNTSSKKEPAEG